MGGLSLWHWLIILFIILLLAATPRLGRPGTLESDEGGLSAMLGRFRDSVILLPLLGIAASGLWSVIARYGFNAPIANEEMMGLLGLVVVMLGLAWMPFGQRHVRSDIAFRGALAATLADLIMGGLLLALAIHAFQMFGMELEKPERTPVQLMPMWLAHLTCGLGAGLAGLLHLATALLLPRGEVEDVDGSPP